MPWTFPAVVSTVQKIFPGVPPPPRIAAGRSCAAAGFGAATAAAAAVASEATWISSRRVVFEVMVVPPLAARGGRRRRVRIPVGADFRARIDLLARVVVEQHHRAVGVGVGAPPRD